MNIMNRVTLKSMRKNKRRTIVTIIGVIISVAMITAVSTFSASFTSLFRRQEVYENGDWIASVSGVTKAQAQTLADDPLFDKAGYIRRDVFVQLTPLTGGTVGYMELLSADKNAQELNAFTTEEGRLPRTPDEICLPADAKKYLSCEIGDKISLTWGERLQEGETLPHNFSISEGETFVPLGTKEFTVSGFRQNGAFGSAFPTAVAFCTPDMTAADETVSVILRTKEINSELYNDVQNLIEKHGISVDDLRFHNILLNYSGVMADASFFVTLLIPTVIVGLIIMIGSVMLIYNAFAISVSERSKQLGMLASVGATRKQKMRSVLFEGFVIGVIAIPIGILCGIAGIGITFRAISPWMMNVFNISVPFKVEAVPAAIAAAVVFSAFTILISSWRPARRASRITPIEAIRQSQDIRLQAKKLRTPRLTKMLFGFEGELALKNLKRNRKRYRATTFALCVSVVLFLTTAGFNSYMLHSYDMTLMDIPFDLYFSAANRDRSEQDALLHLPGTIKAEMTDSYQYTMAVPYDALSDEVKARREQEGNIPEEQVPLRFTLLALDEASEKRYLEKAGLSPDILNEQNSAVAINRFRYQNGHSYYDSHKTLNEKTGVSLPLCYEYKTDESFSVKAFTGEKPLSVAEVTMNDTELNLLVSQETLEHVLEVHRTLTENAAVDANRTYCFVTNDAAALTETLRTDYAGYPVNVMEQKQQIQNLLNIANVFLYGFITLITLISAANIFNTISTSISLRTREFAMLRSVGMTKQSFNKMLRFESVFYGLKALLWGIPISLAVDYLMYTGLARNFDFTFFVPVWPLVIAVLAIFAIVGLTMLYSSSKVKKANIISILTQENI